MSENKIKDDKFQSLVVRKLKYALIWMLALVNFVFLSDVLGTAVWQTTIAPNARTNIPLMSSAPILVSGILELTACLLIGVYVYCGFGPLLQWFKTRHSERR